ncbi:MAG: putative membrane protein [Chlamydiales bacterium]|jgi:uncharacterized membrane protein
MKKHFVTGLIFLLPLAVTVAIVVLMVNFLTQPFVGFVENLLRSSHLKVTGFLFITEDSILHYGSQIIILVGLFLATVFLGILTRWFFINYLISLGDYILHRIPLINKLYKTSQDIIRTLFSSETDSFKQVVMVPFPNLNSYCVGLVTRESPPSCREAVNSDLVSVFLPTTPNPTSGYLLMFRKEDIHYLDMKVEDAVKFIISCGVIYPGSPETTPNFDKDFPIYDSTSPPSVSETE